MLLDYKVLPGDQRKPHCIYYHMALHTQSSMCCDSVTREETPEGKKGKNKKIKNIKKSSFNDQPPVCILVPLMGFKVILLAPCEVFLCQ